MSDYFCKHTKFYIALTQSPRPKEATDKFEPNLTTDYAEKTFKLITLPQSRTLNCKAVGNMWDKANFSLY